MTFVVGFVFGALAGVLLVIGLALVAIGANHSALAERLHDGREQR